MSYTKQIQYAPAVITAVGGLTNSFQPISSVLPNPASIEKFVNNSTTDIEVSVDGVNVCDIIPAGGAFVFDDTANKAIDNVFAKAGTQYYLRVSQNPSSVYFVMKYIRQI
jgi:hypothetical protein